MGFSEKKIMHILRYHWPLIFFLLAAVFATCFSVDYRQSIGIQFPFLFGIPCYFLITTLAGRHNRLRLALLALPGVFVLVAVFVISKIIGSGIDTSTAQVKALGVALFD